MKLIASILFFDDNPVLFEKCLESVMDFDRIVAIDGRYRDWPNDTHLLTQGPHARFCGERKNVELIQPKEPWKGEAHKREASFVGAPGDWYVLLDADEEFVGNVKYLKWFLNEQEKNLAFCGVRIYRPLFAIDPMTIWHRVVRHLPGLHYQPDSIMAGLPGYHDLQDKDGNRLAPPDGTTGLKDSPHKGARCDVAHLVHWQDLRTADEVRMKQRYERMRTHR